MAHLLVIREAEEQVADFARSEKLERQPEEPVVEVADECLVGGTDDVIEQQGPQGADQRGEDRGADHRPEQRVEERDLAVDEDPVVDCLRRERDDKAQ